MLSISSLFSVQYLTLFLPVVAALYALTPRRGRPLVLLGASYVFFWAISGKLLIYLVFTTGSLHYAGLWLDALQRDGASALAEAEKAQRKALRKSTDRKRRGVVLFAVALNLGALLALKYAPFFAANANTLLARAGVSWSVTPPALLLPIGISFYTLQGLSYLVDVYRGRTKADRNLLRFALFMSFFPQIIEGPICRYSETADALWAGKQLRFQTLVFAAQRIFYGMLKKIVVADRLNLFVQTVFTDYAKYDGGVIALGAVLYTVQLYMDFSGSMDLVMATGQIFGVKMPENFRQPFFSHTISEFWKRWHISLGAWFRDYVFYPVSMAAPMKRLTSFGRKHLGRHYGALPAGAAALLCVWLCNGLWHGAGWNYIFFGLYHFALILGGNLLEPAVLGVRSKLGLSGKSPVYRGAQMLRTAILVCIGELFFAAHGLRAGFAMFRKLVTEFSLAAFQNGTVFTLGLDQKDAVIVGAVLAVVLAVGILRERGVVLGDWLPRQNLAVRFGIAYALILAVVIFGAYGKGYVPVDPMYAGF